MGSIIYDEEFQKNLKLAKVLIGKIKCQRDRLICARWISKLYNLQSEDILVKKYRNAFFRYMLRMMQGEARHFADYEEDGSSADDEDQAYKAVCRWSPDKRTYTAVKPLGCQGALVYMAVAKDPSLGWDVPAKR